ncbi:hypothetical protein [Aquimarina pacifica]|uniref:hypothetical protein n=1 Tax=Aquimarina pacifica TaxID=1296415 RepID=UPI000471E706|nr:hypothetical protein [Aquimarina pacifica]
MIKKIIYILLLVFISCAKQTKLEDAKNLNGYWEIEYVMLSDGSKKQYNFNKSVDFFEIKDSIGVRKKVQPQLDGSFIINNDSKTFRLKIENDSIRMYYKTEQATWKESLISSKENKMAIKNETGNIYFYKRFKKIKL